MSEWAFQRLLRDILISAVLHLAMSTQCNYLAQVYGSLAHRAVLINYYYRICSNEQTPLVKNKQTNILTYFSKEVIYQGPIEKLKTPTTVLISQFKQWNQIYVQYDIITF